MAVNFQKPSFKPIYARSPGNQQYRTDILQAMQKDPATTTGYIIGTMLGNDYWGKKRARSAAEAVNATEPGATDWQQANGILDTVASNLPPVTSNVSAADAYKNEQPAGNVLYSPEITTPQQRGQAPVTPENAGLLGGLKDPNEMYRDMERQTTFNPGNTGFFTNGIRDLSNVIGGKPNTLPVLPANNPTGAETVTQLAEQGASQPFNAQQRMNSAIQYLMDKKGYSPEDAAAILNPYMAGWQEREAQENKAAADNIMQQLGSGELSDADYKQRLIQLANLGDYGRNAANVYGRDLVSGQDKWRAQQQQAIANQRFAQQQALNNANNQARLQLAAIRGAMGNNGRGTGNRTQGNGNAKSPLASEEFKFMTNRLNEIAGIPEEERTAEQKQFFGTYAPIRDSIVNQSLGNTFSSYGVGPNAPSRPATNNTFNPNNYDQAAAKFQALASSGKYNRGDIESFIRQKYGLKPDDKSNQFVEDIINGIKW